jgi:putative oxidoreductase
MINLGLLVLRLGLGVMFLAHGVQKLFGGGMIGFSEMLKSLGFVPALFWANVAGYTELIGAILLILGVLPRFSAGILLIVISVAMFKVHLAKGFFLSSGGFEYTFVIACACLAIILSGAGKISLLNKF